MSAATTTTTPLTMRTAWKALERHHAEIEKVHLRDLFARDPGRGERLAAEGAGLYLDYSKNRITEETIALLLQLAREYGDFFGAQTVGVMPYGLSIAMGQSGREVHRAARRVTKSNEEDGFADAVERFILGANRKATLKSAERS